MLALVLTYRRPRCIAPTQRFRYGTKDLLVATLAVAIGAWTIKSFRGLYDHYGAIGSVGIPVIGGMVMIATCLTFFCFAWPWRVWLYSWMIILVVFCARQATLSNRLSALHRQVAQMATFARTHREVHGAYPKDIDTFAFEDSHLKRFVEYELWSDDSYVIRYQPNGPGANITHGYSPDSGFWFEDD